MGSMNKSTNLACGRYPQQAGIGMVEVLVALVLLAVAALGYVGLQTRALKSTDDALIRTQALTIMRSGAEKIRTNISSVQLALGNAQNTASSGISYPLPTSSIAQTVLGDYQAVFNAGTATSATTTACTLATDSATALTYVNCLIENANATAKNDYIDLNTLATNYNIKLGMTTCPGTDVDSAEKTKCLIAAWNNTTATMGSTSTDCLTSTGSYNTNADCVYMETY